MLLAMLFAAFLGLFAGNAFPHFVAGITKKDYPSALGNGPVVNFTVGLLGLNISGLLAWWAWPTLTAFPLASALAASVGLLAIGLFHAGPGAFGRKA
jgi:hypothetical protein